MKHNDWIGLTQRRTVLRWTCLLFFGVALAAGAFAGGYAPRPGMKTPWGEKVTPENAWREHPRPQMVRSNWTNLNGLWDYAVTGVTATPGRPEKWDGKILVPFALESALSGVGRLLEPDQFLWYTRKITVEKKVGERILLHFGAVDFRTMVFIGHNEVTDVPHEGGQNPFTLDITDYVADGENELAVCVWDPTEDFVNSRGKQSFRPGGCFYTRVSGIWQTVWMERVPETYIRGYKVFTDVDASTVRFEFDVAGKGDVEVKVDGVSQPGEPGKPGEVTVKVPDAKLWSPESPHLYRFTAKCGKDEIRGYFGMRKFEKRKDARGVLRFYLNNEPYFILGTLDQGWWPDGLLTPPSEEAMAFDIKTLKNCGFNMMRKHIKVEPARYYYLCDKMGLLLVQDLPSGNNSWRSPAEAKTTARYWLERQEQKEMMDALQAAPSIVIWSPYNEGWSQPGEFLTHAMLDFVRRYDRTRLVNGPSGCWDWEGGNCMPKDWVWLNRVWTAHRPVGTCEAGDMVDMHIYRGPTMFPLNDRRVSFLGEFGGLGHPVQGHTWKAARGSWGYGGIADTKTREGLEKTYLRLMNRLEYLAWKGLGGSVYTQTTDVEIEINGLMTYDRKVLKFDPKVLKAAHGRVIAAALDAARCAVREVLPCRDPNPKAWAWTTQKPAEGWQQPSFDDSGWARGAGGFGSERISVDIPYAKVATSWTTRELWLRRRFTAAIPPDKVARAVFNLFHDEDAEVYLNGKMLISASGYNCDWDPFLVSGEVFRAAFRSGENVLSVHVRQKDGGQYFDLGLGIELKK